MRRVPLAFAFLAFLALTGCGPAFVLHQPATREEMLAGASLVVVGVIEEHKLESWPSFRVQVPPGPDAHFWQVLRRRVRVETVLSGSMQTGPIDIYEVTWTAGASGNWNATQDGERAVFPLRKEHGYYRVAGDWWRSIFPVTTGPHARLPLDDSYPLWERIALMNWWITQSDAQMRINSPSSPHHDPAGVITLWRTVKLLRGLLRHPSPGVRVPACRELLSLNWGQDECWDLLTSQERAQLREHGARCCTAEEVAASRQKWEKRSAAAWWRKSDRDTNRLLTAISHPSLRREFCRLFQIEYPGDTDNGCPPGQPPPATIVTPQGDVPLLGPWPP